jgi:hypothetical protein
MCGLDNMRDGKIAIAKNRKDNECLKCDAAVVRANETQPKRYSAESKERRKLYLESKPWKPNS